MSLDANTQPEMRQQEKEEKKVGNDEAAATTVVTTPVKKKSAATSPASTGSKKTESLASRLRPRRPARKFYAEESWEEEKKAKRAKKARKSRSNKEKKKKGGGEKAPRKDSGSKASPKSSGASKHSEKQIVITVSDSDRSESEEEEEEAPGGASGVSSSEVDKSSQSSSTSPVKDGKDAASTSPVKDVSDPVDAPTSQRDNYMNLAIRSLSGKVGTISNMSMFQKHYIVPFYSALSKEEKSKEICRTWQEAGYERLKDFLFVLRDKGYISLKHNCVRVIFDGSNHLAEDEDEDEDAAEDRQLPIKRPPDTDASQLAEPPQSKKPEVDEASKPTAVATSPVSKGDEKCEVPKPEAVVKVKEKITCPVCNHELSDSPPDQRIVHINECLDRQERRERKVRCPSCSTVYPAFELGVHFLSHQLGSPMGAAEPRSWTMPVMLNMSCPLCPGNAPEVDLLLHFQAVHRNLLTSETITLYDTYVRRCFENNSTNPKTEYLVVVLTKETSSKAGECSICCEDFCEGQEAARLQCLCLFHKHCIEQWFTKPTGAGCPVHNKV
ncbi:E3 ubiquitin-protein ligase ZNRF1/2 [Pelomyxa schiedti]|nr:E3 ubiquitin-protein ligase ZNRF1/2 [Pelomyxa schiedti]